ncbi:MAG: alpha-xylosidase, partial [Cohnella sp.]|nr:alpha-xylosidase [Cohnella sp.]
AMLLEFPEDPTTRYLDTQYMLGERMLVAPIFNEEGIAKYYVPQGKWTNFIDGKTIEGGRWVEEKHGYSSIPLLVRPNSLIAVGNNNQRPDYDYADNVTLHLFELEDGPTATAAIHDLNGNAVAHANAVRSGNAIEINVEGEGKPWQAVLRGIESVASVEGAEAHKSPEGVRLKPHGASGLVKVTL